VAQLRKATPEQIAEVRGVGPTLATAIFERLAEGGRGETADAHAEEGQATGASR
jgi:excinuclease ABC subunit C